MRESILSTNLAITVERSWSASLVFNGSNDANSFSDGEDDLLHSLVGFDSAIEVVKSLSPLVLLVVHESAKRIVRHDHASGGQETGHGQLSGVRNECGDEMILKETVKADAGKQNKR